MYNVSFELYRGELKYIVRVTYSNGRTTLNCTVGN